MSLDALPLWSILLGTIALVLLSIETGIRQGRRRQRAGKGKLEVSAAMVGAVMGLLSFLLAFTFNGAATRHESRKAMVVKEANAVEQAWLRAGFLDERQAGDLRSLLRLYVDVRLNGVTGGPAALAPALRQSLELHAKMWALVEEAGRRAPGSIVVGLLVQSINEVIDVHVERFTLAVRNRVLPTIWLTLYLLLVAGMLATGVQIGQSTTRQFSLELALALTFSTVMFLIVDLDRPREGLLTVSQEAMVDLQTRMRAH